MSAPRRRRTTLEAARHPPRSRAENDRSVDALLGNPFSLSTMLNMSASFNLILSLLLLQTPFAKTDARYHLTVVEVGVRDQQCTLTFRLENLAEKPIDDVNGCFVPLQGGEVIAERR